jgi:uncharacterized protein (TIGR00255 family)
MTGFGEARRQAENVTVAVEIRTINSRHFKLNIRAPEGYGSLETQIEELLRRYVNRATAQVWLRIEQERSPDNFRFNEPVLIGYFRHLETIAEHLKLNETPRLDQLVDLPGVVDESAASAVDSEAVWPTLEAALMEAAEKLSAMRSEEGRHMAADLEDNCNQIAERLAAIERLAPGVVVAYQARLTDRLNRLLAKHEIQVEPSEIIKEVGVFAERSDISEEIVRLRSHIAQFLDVMKNEDQCGKKLEFLTQEMFREANTIGSKAGDSDIAHRVVEIKTAVERMREMVQNVE